MDAIRCFVAIHRLPVSPPAWFLPYSSSIFNEAIIVLWFPPSLSLPSSGSPRPVINVWDCQADFPAFISCRLRTHFSRPFSPSLSLAPWLTHWHREVAASFPFWVDLPPFDIMIFLCSAHRMLTCLKSKGGSWSLKRKSNRTHCFYNPRYITIHGIVHFQSSDGWVELSLLIVFGLGVHCRCKRERETDRDLQTSFQVSG